MPQRRCKCGAPVLERYRHDDSFKFFRDNAAFAIPELYKLLVSEGCRYAIRLKTIPILKCHIRHLLTRPVHGLPIGGGGGSVSALLNDP